MRSGDEITGNRAVSALFRVFGGPGRREIADGFERTRFPAMHHGERLVLGWLVPLTLFAALSEWLVKGLGAVAGWIVLPIAGFLLLTVAGYFVPGTRPAAQWRWWLALLAAWGFWRMDAGGYVRWFAWMWIGIFALNAIALALLGMGRLFSLPGRAGIGWRASVMAALHAIALAAGWKWGWTWTVAGGAAIAIVYCAAVLSPYRQWLGKVVRHLDGRGVLITIDDGPDPHETPPLLDMLDRQGTKALFFMIGEKVRRHPELAREVVRRGHAIGNHTMTHPQLTFWAAGPARTRREIEECQRVIEEVTGVTPEWFRAPVGHRNLFTHPVAKEHGLKVMAWSRRGFDAIEKDPDVALGKILPLSKGDIVLMHEGTGIAGEVLGGILSDRSVQSM